MQQLARYKFTEVASADHMTHPGAPSPPNPGPMNGRAALLERRERAAESTVQVVCVLLSLQLPAVWMWWDVCGRPVYPDEERGLVFVSTFLTLASGGGSTGTLGL